MLSAIVPVKSFSDAKSRLAIDVDQRIKLCEMMLGEVLTVLSASNHVDSIVVVSGDQAVFDVARRHGVVEIEDGAESGVNSAVALADKHIARNSPGASIVFPQDIPFIMTQDIDFLLQFWGEPPCVLVVPSRKFDGTNALLRDPACLMGTHYDEDSYKIHLSEGRRAAPGASLVFIRRIMMDIDDIGDLRYAIAQNEKPALCERITNLGLM